MDYLKKMEQVKKIKEGAGIQYLLDEAYKILGNPIAMFDTEYKLIAYNEVVTDDPIWIELIGLGTFGKETQKLFESEGFIEEVANSRIAELKSKKLKYDRINGKVFNKNNSYVSNLIIVACNKPFEDDDIKIFEVICRLISKEISKNEFFQNYEQEHQETIIKSLIEQSYDKKLDLAQIEIIYESLSQGLYIVAADASQSTSLDVEGCKDLIKQIRPRCKCATYKDYIVIIISTNHEVLNAGSELKELIAAFEHNNIYAGISGRFENLFELHKHYAQAIDALRCVTENKSCRRFFPYYEESRDTMRQIKTLENGKGVQYFLDIGPEIFGNPLLFHDLELNLLGYSANAEISDSIWQELIAYGTSSDETINLFSTEGFIDTMERTKGGALLVSKKIKYDRISWKIYSRDNIMIGCSSIVNTNRPFNEDDLVLFGAFSQNFSKEISENEFYKNYGQVYSDTVINRLLDGNIDDYTYYTENISNLYDKLMTNMYLFVVDTSKCGAEVNLTYIRDLFNRPGAINRYAIYNNHIVIIASKDDAVQCKNIGVDNMDTIFKEKDIYAGVSRRIENIHELQYYYKQALNALQTGLKSSNDKNIFRCEEPF